MDNYKARARQLIVVYVISLCMLHLSAYQILVSSHHRQFLELFQVVDPILK